MAINTPRQESIDCYTDDTVKERKHIAVCCKELMSDFDITFTEALEVLKVAQKDLEINIRIMEGDYMDEVALKVVEAICSLSGEWVE